jgi:membrane protein required for colicin V production
MTAADFIIVGTLLLSGILAMARGFTQELLSIIAFIAAALIALFLEPYIKPLVEDHLPKGWAGTGIVVAATFFLILIPLWILSGRLSQGVRQSKAVGAIDRMAGFVFGALRGLFILAVAFIIFKDALGSERNLPGWVKDARLLPLVEKSADFLMAILPEESPIGRDA